MYYEIKRLIEDEHYSLRRVSDYLGINFRTVKKYYSMSSQEFDGFIACKFERSCLLDPYRDYIVSCLQECPDTPASVIHDKLKERFCHFPDVHPKTVYNYVIRQRSAYGIGKESYPRRQYFPVADLSPGDQAQVDFGEKKLRTGTGAFIRVYFFAMVLCFSRYKFVLFRDHPFTSQSAVEAHEKAFEFFRGIPREIIHDQDCVFIHDENRGDYVMTDVFTRYQACRPFKITFCRGADPESKGKVENVVKYVKQNFLYNRPFADIDLLNLRVAEWLHRTGNKMIHNTTRKIPFRQWEYGQPFLLVWHPLFTANKEKGYKVLKTNVVKYKGNSYSLPFGTYRGEDSRVHVCESEGNLILKDIAGKTLATHLIPDGTGHTIINTHHRRNTSLRLNELREKVREFFRHGSSIEDFLSTIDRLYPRYVRDQLTVLLVNCEKAGLERSEIALEFCIRNNIASCNDFKSVLEKDQAPTTSAQEIKPLGDAGTRLMGSLEPGKSDINEYETLFANNK